MTPFYRMIIHGTPSVLLLFICCATSSVYAQYGPIGIGNNNGSDGQPKLLLWLDGSTPAVGTGANVITWPDKSGNNNHFSAVAATSPILRAGGPESRPYLEFSKANNHMSLANLQFTNQGVSIFYVFKTSDSNYGMFSFAQSNANARHILISQVGTAPGCYKFTVAGNEYSTTINNMSNNVWRYAGFVWDGQTNPTYWMRSSGNGVPELTQNAVLDGLISPTTGTAVIGHIQTLLNGGFNTTESFQGDLAEIIVYDGKVNKVMLRMLNSYFVTKYGVGGTGGWDKMQAPAGYKEGLVMLGRDAGSSSEHLHSRADGLVLRANPGGLQGSFSYLGAGNNAAPNSVVISELPIGTEGRWNRIWYMRNDGLGDGSNIQIAFDFGEGIGGDFPQNPENYVLLYRSGTSGSFSERPVTEKSITNDEVVFRLSGSQIANGYYTIGTKNNILSSLTGQIIRSWYTYQSGNWSDPGTWTLDGSAAPYYVNPSSVIPAAGDAIYIGSGRSVLADLPNRIQTGLKLFGTLDLGTLNGHNFNAISGSGVLRCAGTSGISNFPLGSVVNFANASTGGTVEFYGNGFTIPHALVVNKFKIDLSTNGSAIVMGNNLTHNGFFEINRGTFTVNDGSLAIRTITSNSNVLVESNGTINVHPVNNKHIWTFQGNFVNDGGNVRFTNRITPNYTQTETSGWVEAKFISNSINQELIANGTSFFSRLVINKGLDDSYVLHVTSDGPNKFQLLGFANQNFDSPQASETLNTNSVCLVYGTLRVGNDIFLPLHVNSGNYCINESTTLWVDGGVVTKGFPIGATGTAIVSYGKIRITAGELNANCNSGITIRDNGIIQVDGGTLNANQIRTSVFGPENIGGLIINGGLVSVDGTRAGGINGSYYSFSLTYPGNLFRMSGGELRVAGPSGKGLIFINSRPDQTSVNGGTIYAEVKNTTAIHRLTSRAPLWNLEIVRTTTGTNRPVIITGGDSFGEIIENTPLIIKNNLTIRGANAATLNTISVAASPVSPLVVANLPQDVYIEGNFTIENGGVYTHGLNTTYFDGNSNSILSLPTTSTLNFNNLVVSKNESTRFARIQSGNSTNAMQVLGDFRLERGNFINNHLNVQFRRHVTLKGEFGDTLSAGAARFEGNPLQQVLTVDRGVFHNLEINNAAGVRLVDNGLVVRGVLSIINGNFFLNDFKLRMEGENASIIATPTATSRMIAGSGRASAGGLEIFFKSANQVQDYPVGVEIGATVKYTPAQIIVNNDFVSAGYIQVVPVDALLNTTNLNGGPNYLDFYWKVAHSDFLNLPRVSHKFTYHNTDIIGLESQYASGRVLADDPFTRQVDSLSNSFDHVNTVSNEIFYNSMLPGDGQGATSSGPGTVLTEASYSAGNALRFTGRPRVFYSNSVTLNADWNLPANWNEMGAFGMAATIFDYHAGPVGGNTFVPTAGDIAFIGFNLTTERPHSYEAPAGGITASEVRFTPLQNADRSRKARYYAAQPADITVLRPTLAVTTTAQIQNIKVISGEGALLLRGNVDLRVTDIGGFLDQDSSIVILQPAVASLQCDFIPANIPNLLVTSRNFGALPDILQINTNTFVRGKLEIIGNAKLQLSNGVAGNILVGGNVILDKYQALSSAPELRFSNAGTTRNFETRGTLGIQGNGAQVRVINPNTTAPQTIHKLTVWKDIYQDAPASVGLNLALSALHDFVVLELKGGGNHSFINANGLSPSLGKIILDKGTNVTSSFSFNSFFSLNAPTNLPENAVILKNGLLKINDSAINITLTSGGGDYNIPATAGLELNAGTLKILGPQIGMTLSGELNITGGLMQIGNTPGENNYLEYSSSASAKINVSGGTLSVGSQIRRGLTNTEGVLKYTQTGGEVLVGVHSAPSQNRGVFEVLNTGSSFTFTGGKITLVRGVNSNSTPSFHIDTQISNTTGNGQVVIGNAGSPAGAEITNVGIKSNVSLQWLEMNNASGNNPVAKLLITPLTIRDAIFIDGGATLNCQGLNLTVQGDVENEGALLSPSGKLILDHNSFSEISGAGSFIIANLERIGGGITLVNTDLLVTNELKVDQGIMDFGSNQIWVQGNVQVDGELRFLAGSEGLILNGNVSQILRRSGPGISKIDVLTTDNPAGITLIASAGHVFEINKTLRMKRGIFDLRGNLLELGLNSSIEQVNAFGENNMISTGGAFTNFGVRKVVPANYTQDVFMPLGIDKYMPVRLIFSDVGFQSGTTISNYLFRLSIPQNSVVVNDVEAVAPQINDLLNVLQMNFYLKASNVGANLRMDAEFMYDDAYVSTTAPYNETDYISARVVDNTPVPDIFKSSGVVDPVNNIIAISFTNITADGITGDYFAGVDPAIPDNVPLYVTQNGGGFVTNGANGGTYVTEVPGGGAPSGAVVQIVDNHVLNFNASGISFYKTIIEENATLQISATSFHRLGIVEGTGTVRLISSGTLPTGIYNDFFTCSGGKIEYAGSGNHEILANIPTVRQVTLTGSGQRNLSNNDVTICENLVVNGPIFQNSSAALVTIEDDLIIQAGSFNSLQGNLLLKGNLNLGNGTFTATNLGTRTIEGNINMSGGTFAMGTGSQVVLKGDFIKTGGTFTGGSGVTNKFTFGGTTLQTISGNFTSAPPSNQFYRMELNNAAGVSLNDNLHVSLQLLLTNGKLFTEPTGLLHLSSNTTIVAPNGGSNTSFVDGPMEWNLAASNSSAANDRTFPVGKDAIHRPLKLSQRSLARIWTVQYFDTLVTLEPQVETLIAEDPIAVERISKLEYWKVNSNSNDHTTARVGLSWGANSLVSASPGDYNKLVVLAYKTDTDVWESFGSNTNTFAFDIVAETGSFLGQNLMGFTEKFITLGSTDNSNPLPVSFLYFAGATNGVEHKLSWATASETNNDYFQLERSLDGRFFQVIARIEGAGNSVTQNDYSYLDKVAPAGRVYYRLKQVDFDGAFDYAQEIVTLVKIEAQTSLDFVIYPNPTVQKEVRLMISDFRAEMALISIADLSGKKLKQSTVWIDEQGISDTFTCDFDPGIYVVSIVVNNHLRSKPLVISK